MENQNIKDKVFEEFTWTIKKFSTLDSKKLHSETCSLDGHTWTILIYPKGNVNYLTIYLEVGVVSMPKFATFKFILINQLDHRRNIVKEINQTFNRFSPSFIPLGELSDSGDGFIVNDTCIIKVHILVHKSEHEKQVGESVRNIENKLDQSTENLSTKEIISTSIAEVVDFMGIGKVEKDFVPLLEEVCSRYPSLIDSKKRKSQRFTEWTFTALGRVLHFLKFKKVRDMDDDTCNHLQILWEELETCGFDLSWLKPHVQSALGMKTCVEKVPAMKRLEERVTTLEKNVAVLEMEAKTLRAKMIEAEVNLEITRRDLVKAKENFENCDLDAELGYEESKYEIDI